MQLELTNVSKAYPNGIQALRDVSLSIGPGMFGLLGANGAGKSTLMRTIATLQLPDAGQIRFNGIDLLKQPDQIRRELGYLPQEFGAYPRTSAAAMLDHLARLKGITARAERREVVAAMLQRVNLYEHRFKSIAKFSGGMKQRFGIAQALLGNPSLLIVDEPTAGLDPSERNRFYNLLSEVGEHTIVILSTHIVQDVRELCREMAILNRGELLYSGTPETALQQLAGCVWQRTLSKEQLDAVRAEHQVLSEKRIGGQPTVHVYCKDKPGPEYRAIEADLEDVYFSVTNPREHAA